MQALTQSCVVKGNFDTPLNPTERFGRYLKDIACGNTLFSGLDAPADSVRSARSQQNS